uniref:Uncharacterized protein n=1 Tax=Ditylenchus dipsaci TaxID=166011 RepID=A0A915D8X6_9BILA
MSLTPVWWACDLHRHIQHKHFNVVIDTGTAIKKGFTVEDVAAFLNALATVCPASVENGFPKSYSQNTAVSSAFPPNPHVMPIIKPEKELHSEEKHPFMSSPLPNALFHLLHPTMKL